MNARFEPLAAFGPGIHLVEASAGTGKTYSITNLVVRLVAEEDVRLREILVVTFTRAATAELRQRIHTRLGLAMRVLEGSATDDTLADWSLAIPEDEREAARQRLLRARLEIDTAPILTIHGFCQRALDAHAFESATELGLELTPDTTALYDSVVRDEMASRLFEASRSMAALLKAGADVTLSGMQSYASRFLGEPELDVLPEADPALIDMWLDRVEALQGPDAWIDELEEVLIQSSNQGNLHLGSYKESKIRAYVSGLRDWLGQGAPPGGAARTVLGKLTTSAIDKSTKKGGVAPKHPFFETAEELIEASDGPVIAIRASLAGSLRSRFKRALTHHGVRTYQGLIDALRAGVNDPDRGPELVRGLRSQYRVGLIDEFQDTDSAQWEIFRAVFDDGERRLFLIGDPKQSVYRFRGANIHTYTEAKRSAGKQNVYTMDRNFRSDQAVVSAIEGLMDFDTAFRDPELRYIRVSTPTREPERRIRCNGSAQVSGATVRWWEPSMLGVNAESIGKTEMNERLPALVAEDIRRQLGTVNGLPLYELFDDEHWRAVRPSDVAVLVNRNDQAAAIQSALLRVGVPAVIAARQSVYESEESEHVARWLDALSHPRSSGALRGFLATPIGGWTAQELDDVDDRAWDYWSGRVVLWRRIATERGILASFRRTLDDLDAEARLLEAQRGRRRLTNYRHIAELLHDRAAEERLGLRALGSRLAQLREDPPKDDDDALVRLEMDDEAVRVVTVHRSKGLEYPIVHVPFATESHSVSKGAAKVGADPDNPTRRLIRVDADTQTAPAQAFLQQLERDASAEEMRKLYVALTRAELEVTIWMGPQSHKRKLAPLLSSPVGHCLVRDSAPETVEEIRAQAHARVESHPELQWRESPVPASPYRRAQPNETELSPQTWTRPVAWQNWGVGSFSSFVTGLKALDRPDAHAVEPDAKGRETADGPELEVRSEREVRTLERFPAGRRPGTCLHAVFENVPFAGAREDATDASREEFDGTAVRILTEHGYDGGEWRDEGLMEDLRDVLRAPLGPEAGGLCLADLPDSDRLAELRFDLPVAGGRAHAGETWLSSDELQRIVRAREGTPYGRLADPLEPRQVAGFLTGIIDLVFRVHTVDGERWFVADYKSNRFDGDDPALTYTADAIAADAASHHYPLQAHIYLLALHRFLAMRLGSAYDYDTHIGGTYLLYLRGMIGRGDPQPGVLFDRPPRETIEALHALFDRGQP